MALQAGDCVYPLFGVAEPSQAVLVQVRGGFFQSLSADMS